MGCCCASAADDEEAAPLADGVSRDYQSASSDKRREIEAIKKRYQEGRVGTPSSTAAPPPVRVQANRGAGRFEVGKSLGKGAFGEVRQATNKSTKEVVAVKMISVAQLSLDKAGSERLEREIAILQALSHPNLVNLHEVLAHDDTGDMWIVLEFVDGADLMQVIDKEVRIQEPKARVYLRQMVVGLNYVHSQQVSHRDLKPENIMITKDDRVKITDFGLSNFQRTDTAGEIPAGLSLKTCCGTPYYVAPEVIGASEQRGYSGFTCDVWSLGIILFAMLVGDLPFTARDLPELLARIRQGSFRFPSRAQVSDPAKAVVKAMLTADPSRRATLAGVAAFEWVGLKRSDLHVDPVDVPDSVYSSLRATLQSLRSDGGQSR
eukprot:TRINITY_DN46862_c0_g1_i1.p1 TRINITY_DN46862_c0_g1~~TRINITY_DN46862_c0_g1_i1.p1  ORF type:complete len:377 (+),score=65.11 TRINITY_DN46862_c0_g1_i1:152-1282(+)